VGSGKKEGGSKIDSIVGMGPLRWALQKFKTLLSSFYQLISVSAQ
jgi:hypothetical protein